MRQFVVLFALALASTASANLIGKPGFPEGRIINGHEATPGEAPFIVSLQAPSHFCAGTLVSDHTVLTAAHCVTNGAATVVAGLHGRSTKEDIQSRAYNKEDFVAHEKYAGGVGPYDIALIKLSTPFNLNAVARDGSNPVGLIRLPSKIYSGTSAGILFGWGRDNSGSLPENLQKLFQDIIDCDECKKHLPSNANVDNNSNVCSFTANTADGACNGDSGGPLVREVEAGVYEQVGIVSWGYTPCASTKYPSVYTDTSKFINWILEKID